MVRNIIGCLLAVGAGTRDAAGWLGVLAAREPRRRGADLPADGLYFVGPVYDPALALPETTAARTARLAALTAMRAPASRSAA